MLNNPFTPSIIVSSQEDFFGRTLELQDVNRALHQGSVVIHGPVGIGKSSLLSKILQHMSEFDSIENSDYITAVGHSDIKTLDDAARLILEEFVQIDEGKKTLKIGLKFIEYESSSAYRYFVEGRHLAALTKIIEDRNFVQRMLSAKYLIIAIDEADKCPKPLARLLRTVLTKTQLHGIKNIRFVLAGVSPYYEKMVEEDKGIIRFIYKTMSLGPFDEDESLNLLDSKFEELLKQAESLSIPLEVRDNVIFRINKFSGGHPHLLQLLGSHVVEHECEEPDNVIDERDLVGSLNTICYIARGAVYEKQIHEMELESKYSAYCDLIKLTEGFFPGRINRESSLELLTNQEIEWFRSRNIIRIISDNEYAIVDEFLRIRIFMDIQKRDGLILDNEIEKKIIEKEKLFDSFHEYGDYN